ncbi:hypothetical protein [Paractinoplanes lichenicola]|uniref:Uncharacterized protein n=1 Tax=Paractinoplanes lichenicola TaxID=2802976 RepID=A0ABS1VGR5_9ACTN|nr:hypothetical protein [Actinoplanes lichenicola]MBL7253863.1 hypothetical protein [Actinoplanes lichenicola]
MYVRVAIAANAFDGGTLSGEGADDLHRAAAENIAKHGRIVVGSDQEAKELVGAILRHGKLSPSARAVWQAVLVELRKQNRWTIRTPAAAALASISAPDDLRRHWGSDTDVAVVAPETRTVLNAVAAPDVATAETFVHSPALRRIRDLAEDATAEYGSPREQFWTDVLKPLATGALQVTLLDRYLFKALWDLDAGRHWTRRWRGEHLSWLLERIQAVSSPGAEIRLVGMADKSYPEHDAESTAAALRAIWAPRGVRATVTLATPAKVSDFPHDRHIRFSTGGAVTLGAGFDRLQPERIADEDGLSWHYRSSPRAINVLRVREERAFALRHTEAALN